MVKRKRIGLIFSYNENWIAGAYYIMNIIHSLNTLPNKDKPIVTLISDAKSNFDIVKNETHYKYLNFFQFPKVIVHYSIIERIVNKITIKLFKSKIINKLPKYPNIDFLYPFENEEIQKKIENKIKKVNWIPDFQEEHLPYFFSEEEIKSRKKHQKEVVCNGNIVVFSSKDAQKDFNNLYPETAVQQFVLNFAVTHPNYSNKKINDLIQKHNLPGKYFFSPNQFWAHKNQIVILKAIKHLKENGVEVVVAFSGKEDDYRNKNYVSELKEYVLKNNLKNNIKFLGFIPREDQLCLMKNSIAIIQPSLFEGWSTVVEDAKALNKFLILSDLNVHKEQINENVHFFNPENHEVLADILEKYYNCMPFINNKDYNINVNNFAKDFMNLVNLAIKEY